MVGGGGPPGAVDGAAHHRHGDVLFAVRQPPLHLLGNGVKCSDVPLTMAAYLALSEQTDYPLHLGVTEAGTPSMGMVKSAMGIGGLLCLGGGDTPR